MKKLTYLLKIYFLLLLMPIASCTNNSRRLSADEINAINIEIRDAKQTLQQLQNNLSDSKGQLAVEKDKMDRVKEYHLLRTDAERDQQIKAQQESIDNADQRITNIKQQVSNQENTISNLQSKL